MPAENCHQAPRARILLSGQQANIIAQFELPAEQLGALSSRPLSTQASASQKPHAKAPPP
jgi:hypothetical protein